MCHCWAIRVTPGPSLEVETSFLKYEAIFLPLKNWLFTFSYPSPLPYACIILTLCQVSPLISLSYLLLHQFTFLSLFNLQYPPCYRFYSKTHKSKWCKKDLPPQHIALFIFIAIWIKNRHPKKCSYHPLSHSDTLCPLLPSASIDGSVLLARAPFHPHPSHYTHLMASVQAQTYLNTH